MLEVLLCVSIVVQLGAAGLALWFVRVSGQRRGWLLVTAALVLMAARRALTLIQVIESPAPPSSSQFVTEWTALGISVLFLAGVVLLAPSLWGTRRAADVIRGGERHFRLLIENALDVVVLLDAHGVVQYAGASIRRVLGYDPDEIVGTDVLRSVHREDRDRMGVFFAARAKQPGIAPPIEVRLRHRDGSWRQLEAVANNLLADPTVSAIVVNARDVTERRQAEEARARAEAQLQQVVANAPVVFFAVDADGMFTLSEGRGLANLGLEPGEVVGRSVFDVYRDAPPVLAMMRRVLGGELIRELVPVAGYVFDVWAAPARSESGAVVSAVGVATDVTDRERVWAALQESESIYRTLIEQSSDPIYVIQGERFVMVNRAWEELFGYGRAEALEPDFHYTKIIAPESLPMVSERVRARTAGETVAPVFELDAVTRDGRRLNLEVSVAEIVWRGRPAVQGIYRDITERRRAEEALRRSEADYRALVEHATYGIYRSTPDGHFLSVNPALVRMLGYDTATDLLRRDMAHEIYAEPAQRHRLVEEYLDADRIEGLEVTWRRKDGERILVRLGGRPIRGGDGSIECYEMIVEDITDRKALEEQLRQAQKMEAIGQLTGGIAHDFNNILTVILANADIIERGLPSEQPDLVEDLADLRRAARRGSDMVGKLLAYSRRGMLSLHALNLADVIAGLLPMLRRLIPEHIEVRFEPGTAQTTVHADEGAIEQMLLNLATNARDAMPEGGTLRIEISRIVIGRHDFPLARWGAFGEYVRVAIHDTGAGMDPGTRERLFEPFFTTKPPGVGTGLGMAMVYGLVKQLNGFIDVQSTPGQGTTVVLYLPAEPARERPIEANVPVELASSAGTETILLVEDEPAIRRSAKRLLERTGYHVVLAQDGEEALRLFDTEPGKIDLVISDVVMPRLSGRQLYDALHQRSERVRFLFTSGYTRRDVRMSGAIDPSVPFVQKPWDVDEFLRRVRMALDEPTRR